MGQHGLSPSSQLVTPLPLHTCMALTSAGK